MDVELISAVVIVAAVLVGVVVFWLHLRRRDHPETTASHDTGPAGAGWDDPRIPPYPGTDRPADPGAEGMAVPRPGAISPGAEPPADTGPPARSRLDTGRSG